MTSVSVPPEEWRGLFVHMSGLVPVRYVTGAHAYEPRNPGIRVQLVIL